MIIFVCLILLCSLLLWILTPKYPKTGLSIEHPVHISGRLILVRLSFCLMQLAIWLTILGFGYAKEGKFAAILIGPLVLFNIVVMVRGNRLPFYCLRYPSPIGLELKDSRLRHLGFFSVALEQIRCAEIMNQRDGQPKASQIVLNLADGTPSALFLRDAKLYQLLARRAGGLRINPATQLMLFTDYLACDQATVVRNINALVGYKDPAEEDEPDEFVLEA